MTINPKIENIKVKYKQVDANYTDTTGGYVIPNGEKRAVYQFRANGADPNCYVILVWDYGEAGEYIIASTKGDIDLLLDIDIVSEHLTGDGTKALKIIIINDNDIASPYVGGCFKLVKV